jgi:Magnesium chelatase, subunit ChlI
MGRLLALGDRTVLVTTRPFRAPHHTISAVGLIGAGTCRCRLAQDLMRFFSIITMATRPSSGILGRFADHS